VFGTFRHSGHTFINLKNSGQPHFVLADFKRNGVICDVILPFRGLFCNKFLQKYAIASLQLNMGISTGFVIVRFVFNACRRPGIGIIHFL